MSDDVAMLPAEMRERYRWCVDRAAAVCAGLAALNARTRALSEAGKRLAEEHRELMREQKELSVRYGNATGANIKKTSRRPEVAAAEQAWGALMHAIGDPCRLPITDPIVLARFAEFQRATWAVQDSKPAPQVDAEVTELLAEPEPVELAEAA